MKDQNALLRKCLKNDIPAIVFQGTDACAIEILKSAFEIYKRNGCSQEFLNDFSLLINDFTTYQIDSRKDVKIPALSESEKDVSRFWIRDEKAKIAPEILEFSNILIYAEYFEIRENNFLLDKSFKDSIDSIIAKKNGYIFSIEYDCEKLCITYSIKSENDKTIYFFKEFQDCFGKNYSDRMLAYSDFKLFYENINLQPSSLFQSSTESLIKKILGNGNYKLADTLYVQRDFIDQCLLQGKSYSINDTEIFDENIKSIKGNINIININGKTVISFDNFSITDKLTGETSSLDCKGFDLSKASEKEVRDLLSGKKVELADGTGNKKPVSLSKSVSGWCLQAGKLLTHEVDNNACL